MTSPHKTSRLQEGPKLKLARKDMEMQEHTHTGITRTQRRLNSEH